MNLYKQIYFKYKVLRGDPVAVALYTVLKTKKLKPKTGDQ